MKTNRHTNEAVLVFFTSRNKLDWAPVEREALPDWIRDREIIDRLIKGETVRNVTAEEGTGMRFYTAMVIDRNKPMESAINLPERALVRVN